MVTKRQPMVFFPWERHRGLRSVFAEGRVRQLVLAVCAIAGLVWMRSRQRHVAEVRSTRATITTTIDGITAWRADHDRGCPGSLADLVASGYLPELPRDAWGHVLRVVCPGRKDPAGFDVSSDGPDGQPGGLDRVE
jgi:general secretion pathway protein G